MSENGSDSASKEKKNTILSIPPCFDIEKESIEVQKCCVILTNIYRNENSKQIMALMKYSLDLSSPWIPQYIEDSNDQDIEINAEMIRYINKIWFAKNAGGLSKIFLNNDDFNVLEVFG